MRLRSEVPEPAERNHAARIINTSRYRSKPPAVALLEKLVLLLCAGVALYLATRL